ncbi:hypothetical protein BDP27DRAFT_1205128, partial [Rhodocollybia butyracea]
LNVAEDSRISRPGWMGVNASQDVRGEIQEALANTSGAAQTILAGIRLIPYLPHLATAVCDGAKNMFLYHPRLTPSMLAELLPKVNNVVPEFVAAIDHPFSEDDMLQNSRGKHWFSIAGH